MIDNMVMWLSTPEQAVMVTSVLWLSLFAGIIWAIVKAVLDARRWAKLGKAAARSLARLAVFNSWIGAGGWSDDESDYEDRLSKYKAKAADYGDKFLSEFNAQAALAEVELDKSLYEFKQEVLKHERDAVIRAEADSARHQHDTQTATVRSYTCHRESGAERLVRTPLRRGR